MPITGGFHERAHAAGGPRHFLALGRGARLSQSEAVAVAASPRETPLRARLGEDGQSMKLRCGRKAVGREGRKREADTSALLRKVAS